MFDTIVSISTALGVGAISIVRMSGKESINIASRVFKGKDLLNVESHTINYGHIVENGKVIDEVLVSVMRAPRTNTREDVVEINCHGGIAVTKKILELLINNGARMAEAGEFTKRAFLNGRINLLEAEAVMDLINAKTEEMRKLSINHATGEFSNKIRTFREKLLSLLANIEVNIDYPEYEDIEIVTIDDIKKQVSVMRSSLEKIVQESENGRLINNGIKVVIIGRPNVGKSSILNRLLEEEKAIVTDIPGTTRDVVEGSIVLNGFLINFFDTAGIRETDDVVEKVGVEKTRKEMESADLIVAVFNNNEELMTEDIDLLQDIGSKKSIIVVNKSDLEQKIDISLLCNHSIVYTNTNTYLGVKVLKEKIIELFDLDYISEKDYNYFANSRQITLAKEAMSILDDVEKGINSNIPVDMIGIDIKKIWEILGKILGEGYPNELIDQLFSKFCLGK